eukprot:534333-Pleurochrysis_carterae.AAC.1
MLAAWSRRTFDHNLCREFERTPARIGGLSWRHCVSSCTPRSDGRASVQPAAVSDQSSSNYRWHRGWQSPRARRPSSRQ